MYDRSKYECPVFNLFHKKLIAAAIIKRNKKNRNIKSAYYQNAKKIFSTKFS